MTETQQSEKKAEKSVYMRGTYPYVACTWLPESNCKEGNCDLSRKLACRWDSKEYKFAIIGNIPSAFMTVFGLIMVHVVTGMWWPYVAWVSWFMIIWPLGLEALVLCRHCPYYTDSGKTITCWALRFMPKWWKPSPRPMNRLERFVMKYLVWDLTMVWAIPFVAYGIYHVYMNYQNFGYIVLSAMIGIFVALILSLWQFNVIMKMHNCSRCVAFSCPKNVVPRETVDAYLEMNPVMKAAWIDNGYEMDK